ncbi:MAG: EamA-like transporter family protein [candidate division WS6 bacterium OLB20]|uniref:EamA-like transporter family protein n=1 Tax=candidate division WS6 bacterium OLB20 TaxID=1617426 RepID=A0A136M055_9BACT|nr:MAG: EamA-like transporter family protein [candidate division WS6 bacterium OLB20]
MRGKQFAGPALVMIAAALWALDALIRTQLTAIIPSAWIVLLEHLVGFLLLMPLLLNNRKRISTMTKRDWVVMIVLSAVSSVAGTLLFTEALSRSFAGYDFVTPVLLQKLQPLIVVLLSFVVLHERPGIRFYALIPVALIGSYMISFGTDPVTVDLKQQTEVVLLALGAAIAWGSGTVMSKHLLVKLDFAEATALRFLFAVPLSIVAIALTGQQLDTSVLSFDVIIRFVVIAFSTGAAAILLYYRGLKLTRASVATFAELTFPVVSVLIAITALNPYGAPQQLSLANQFGIVLLLIAIILISFEADRRKLGTGDGAPR